MEGGKASDAKAADGDAPVFVYIASLPVPQRGIAERIDALAAKTLPDLRRGVKWGMAYYGVEVLVGLPLGLLDKPLKILAFIAVVGYAAARTGRVSRARALPFWLMIASIAS